MKKLNLYLLEVTTTISWDEYDSAVIAAPNKKLARSIAIDKLGRAWPSNPAHVDVEKIAKKPSCDEGVVCASFNAG